MSVKGLPSGWAEARIGDVSDAINGRAFNSNDWKREGLPIIRIQNLKDAEAPFNYFAGEVEDRFRVNPGDVLFAWSDTPGTSFGAFLWKGPEAVLNQHIFNIRFDRKRLDPRYLNYALNEQVRHFIQQAHGGVGLGHITKQKFLSAAIPVAPWPEQARIVEAIETQLTRLDAAVAALERVQANLKRYRASVLKAAVEGRLVPTEAELARQEGRDYEPASVLLQRILTERRRRWEEAELAAMKVKGKVPKDDGWKTRYEEPAPPETEGLPQLPEGWGWAGLGQLGAAVTGTTPATTNTRLYGGDLSFFKPTDLDVGYHVRVARQYLTALGAAQSRVLPENSVLVTSIGATIGKTGLARVRCATNQQINALVPVENLVDPRFLFWAVVSPFGQHSIISNASSTTLPIINKRRFERLVVPLPPLNEQRRIVGEIERLTSVEEEISSDATTVRGRCNRLRQSILKWAFEGRLVDQDPNDEPASVLLDRVRAERSETKVATVPRRGPRVAGRRRARASGAADSLEVAGEPDS